jgi:Protein of unknown function (DUF2877)
VSRVAVLAIPVTRIGSKAQAALTAAQGRALVLAPLSTSLYLTAGGEVIWLGPPGSVLHPRATLADHGRLDRVPPDGAIALDLAGARLWLPRVAARLAARSSPTAATRAVLTTLRERPECLPAPLGLGSLLVGRQPPFPLERAVPAVVDLARACDTDRVIEAAATAERLLGLGPGLTPAGDDFVGGVLFARNRLAGAAGAAWRQASARLITGARQRTNRISLALLADLAEGYGFEPLHDLADTLERGACVSDVLDPIRRLVRLGHSSGWDLLAGLLVGMVGIDALGPG